MPSIPHGWAASGPLRWGATLLVDGEEGTEMRLPLAGDAYLDLCIQPVPEPPSEPLRLHMDLLGGGSAGGGG